jgi:putative ABC transport system permease protein
VKNSLFVYHLRQALRSLRRDTGLSAAILIGMTVATSMWTVTAAHYSRVFSIRAPASPRLHQVEIAHPRAVSYGQGSTAIGPPGERVRVTYPEARLLSSSGLGTRQFSTFRSRLLVSAAGREPRVSYVRFVGADFFALFTRGFARGGPWTSADESAPVAVVGMAAAAQLFDGGDPAARPLKVEGRPFRVAGVLAEHQPSYVEWDLNSYGLDQDAVYLPYPAARELRARPELPIYQSAYGPTYDDLLRSDTIFVSHWIELPNAESVAAYQRYLDDTLGRRGVGFELRSLASWRQAFANQGGGIKFFVGLTALLLLGGAFNMSRLLLAKGLARTEEIGIHRALGAPRRALFLRHMLEASLLALPAAVLGQFLALPYLALWNSYVHDVDIPLWLDRDTLVMGVVPAALIGIIGGLYPAWRLSSVRPTITVAGR